MTNRQPLVVRLLGVADIERVVPRLAPEVLHRLIDRCGLEACADVVALATPAQLQRLLDIDLWRAPEAGGDEVLDAARFSEWLEVLLQLGPAAAGDRLAAMDFPLVVSGFVSHVAVFDAAAVSGYTTLDGEPVPARVTSGRTAEVGGFMLEARDAAAWDTIVDLLADLQAERPAFFARLMRACVTLSDGARELDGLDGLRGDRDQHLADLAIERETRRDRLGFVAPAEARAFLQAAWATRLDGARPAPDTTARAYLRDLAVDPLAVDATASDAQAPAVDAVLEILAEADIVAPPRALLPAGSAEEDARLSLVRAFIASQSDASAELAFLTNVMLSGGGLHGRRFTAPEASDFVLASCNLGLENWPAPWNEPDVLTAFRVGWALLHRDLCCHAAATLVETLGAIVCADRDLQWSLLTLRHDLRRHLHDGEPWRAQSALDVILTFDTLAWAILLALIAECPSLHAGLTAERVLSIDPGAVTFASCNADIARAREWLASLPTHLT